jgi:monovalent cation:H+ antiporter-2, CPA2 family
VLGLLFGFCLLVSNAGYSMALGAFVIGAVMAEATSLPLIERLIEPLRDMFCAIFFVAVGLLLDPHVLIEYFVPVLVLTVAVVLGKTIAVSLGAFVAGQDGRTSLRIGMSMAQIGEFSFIIATLGISLKVTSAFLYPIAVAVSAITALLTPYLMRAADPLSAKLGASMPPRIKRIFQLYTEWLQSLRFDGDRAVIAQIVRKSLLQVFVNCCLVVALFSGGAYLVNVRELHLAEWLPDPRAQKTLVWGAALLLSLPFLIAAYRKLKALSMLLAEMSIRSSHRHSERVRRIVSELIPALAIAAMMLLLTALSSSILPPIELLALVLVVGALLVVLLRRRLVQWHSQLQIALMDSLQTEQDKH